MKNKDIIKNLSKDEMKDFIRNVYLAGKNGYGFSFCDYNLDEWLEQENDSDRLINITKGLL